MTSNPHQHPIFFRDGRSFWIGCVVVFCAASMVYYHLAIFLPRAEQVRAAAGVGNGYSFGADFYPVWLATREARLQHRDPYSAGMTREIQTGLFGCPLQGCSPSAPPDDRAFVHPAFAEVLVWPLALFPFPRIRIALAVILCAATAISVVLWLRALDQRTSRLALTSIVLLTLSSYPALEGLFADQLGLLVAFLIAAAMASLAVNRLFLSGGLLALALVKPQMTLLVAAYLLLWSLARWRSRWRLIAGFLLVLATLMASSQLIWPDWIVEWLHAIERYRQYSPPPLVCYLAGQPPGSPLCAALIAACVISAGACAWRKRSAEPASRDFALTISILLALTAVALLPGQAVYDHLILLPGILLIAFTWTDFAASRVFRTVLAITALVLAWQWISAPVAIAVRPLLARQLFASHILPIPIRTAASIPFAVLALLVMMSRRVTPGKLLVGARD